MQSILSLISNPADLVLRSSHGARARDLWVGSINALNNNFLEDNDINVVISLCPVDKKLPSYIHHYQVDVQDSITDEQRMSNLVPELTRLIHQARLGGNNVLVHCRAGIQRAPTVIVMYLRRYYRIKDAISMIRQVRPIAFINGYTFYRLLY